MILRSKAKPSKMLLKRKNYFFKVTGSSLAWEERYLDILGEEAEALKSTNMSLYYEAGRSYGDISAKSMFQDIDKLFIGTLIMFSFLQFVLPSRFNWVELRVSKMQKFKKRRNNCWQLDEYGCLILENKLNDIFIKRVEWLRL